MPSEALWDRASYAMRPPLVRALGMAMTGPFFTMLAPSVLLVVGDALCLLTALGVAVRKFGARDR